MQMENCSAVTEFFLVGLSKYPELQLFLFMLCLIMYVIILLGNSLLIIISVLDFHLHTPMYFFLRNLLFLDICYTSSSISPMLIIFRSETKSISFIGCALQMVASLGLGSTECVLLAVMAYDRYVAICNPLRYPIIMNRVLYMHIAAWSWIIGCMNSLVQTALTMVLPFCGNNIIDHLTSNLTVVVLFYGSALFMYMKPKSKDTKAPDEIIGLSYGVVTPMLNPIIYSLRNKELKEALKKVLSRHLKSWKI
ncbi:olfactory receptor 13D1-like [Enhydra lutris kenyoni]|uniref:Olfactory receptor 13D1-like n=1 Tax=Enhydra lutris kenyoni TaxID=391180 RepID=A0A2Y9J879_ENHLU|nr:olfactory receptor 13D1-like [Enhydra lutris kenyoni]